MGSLCLYARTNENDWQVGISRGDPYTDREFHLLEDPAPEGTSWRRIGSLDNLPELAVKPAFPNRPIVVRPEVPYTLLPGEKVHFFVGVPIWISLVSPDNLPLVTEPIQVLSNTWFGSPTDGELCYAMRTLARREGESLDFGAWRVVCPVRVRNQTKEKLLFERLCLRVQYLDIYLEPDKGLWANESSVIVRGDEAWSRIAYASSAPAYLKQPKLLVKGEQDPKRTQLFRAITQGRGFFQ